MADLKWHGEKVKKRINEIAMQAVSDGAEFILGKSQDIVPHATGTLQRSGTVTRTKDAVYISYNTPYAVIQHEALGFSHPDPRKHISSSGRRAKYLEDPYNEHAPKVLKLIGARIKKEIGGG